MRPIRSVIPAVFTVLLAACDAADSRPAGDGGSESAAAPATPAAAGNASADPRIGVADTARITGDDDAPVWIVEISDFQCPYCRQWQLETYPQLREEYLATGKAKLAYVNLPLTSLHPHAVLAAEAALCAGAQGRFWEVHDALFATQEGWSRLGNARPAFDSLAAASGVAMDAWTQCVDSQVMRPLIQRDSERSAGSGASSTPTFLIMADSTIPGAQPAMLVGAQPIESFRRAIDALLALRSAPRP